MNQILAGTAALALALVLWSLGRNPGKLRIKNDEKLTNPTNLSPKSLVDKVFISNQAGSDINSLLKNWMPPTSERDRIDLSQELAKLIKANPEERLKAVKIAGYWKHKSVMYILRRGLRDSDSRVVIEAASALNKRK